jgi:glycosyltransferase involved in cell wall biosynthesis
MVCAMVDPMAAIKPLLIISDAVSAQTGLARIARDISTRIHQNINDVYRVATFGFSAPGDCTLGFPQYTAEGVDDWVLPQLPEVWQNFAGEEKGIVMCIWDPSRLGWFAVPGSHDKMGEHRYRSMRKWLEKPPFEKWLYCPVDAGGPNDRLTFSIMKTLFGFDRIIAYSSWGADLIERTMSTEESKARDLCSLPHGIDTKVFSPSPDRKLARSVFPTITGASSIVTKTKAVREDEVLIGIVATNQARKDWALGVHAAAILADKMKVRLWVHTDVLTRHWDILSILIDYGMLGERTFVSTGHIPDQQMAEAYSACDVTLGIGPEGFGYPIFESLFCGTPCVHGNYGGAPEHMDRECLVEPVAFREEGCYNQVRPVYKAEDFAAAVERVLDKQITRPNDLDWENLWPRWEAWFRRGNMEAEK